jgi:OOP family OmpA-OmpF porin
LSADALFDFDSAEMRTAGRQEMDQLIEDLRGMEYEVLNVTGHTDRIGAMDYNQRLSQRRADSVRDYLIANGIPAGDITARGINGSAPVVPASQCTGPVNDALKACLQPDRRVEVEVAALRAPAAP